MLYGSYEPSYNALIESNEELINQVEHLHGIITDLQNALQDANDTITEYEDKVKEVDNMAQNKNNNAIITIMVEDPEDGQTHADIKNGSIRDLFHAMNALITSIEKRSHLTRAELLMVISRTCSNED